MTREAAEEALVHGVDAVWVSNHGGRQLDTVPATIEILPEVNLITDEIARHHVFPITGNEIGRKQVVTYLPDVSSVIYSDHQSAPSGTVQYSTVCFVLGASARATPVHACARACV